MSPQDSEKKERQTMFILPSTVKKIDHIKRAEAIKRGADLTRTDVYNEALDEYIARWEKKNGQITL